MENPFLIQKKKNLENIAIKTHIIEYLKHGVIVSIYSLIYLTNINSSMFYVYNGKQMELITPDVS